MRFFIFFFFLCNFCYSQTKYALFLSRDFQPEKNEWEKNSLVRTDQIFVSKIINDTLILESESLKFVVGNFTEVYFNGEFVGDYYTNVVNTYTNINIQFVGTNFKYFFFRQYTDLGY